MNQPTTPPLTTFKPGEKITGTAMLGEHKGQPVTGEYLAPFGAAKHRALNILTEDGTRIPVSADSAQLAVPTLASSLRQLADLIDQHPEIADWYQFPSLGEHQFGVDRAATLDQLARVFGVAVDHPEYPDTSEISRVVARVGVLRLSLQAATADYRAAAEKAGDAK